MKADLVLTALHVSTLLLWVGGMVSAFVAARTAAGDDVTRHDIAQRVYKWVANPAFLLAFAFGVIRLAMDWRYYFITTHFMHSKLLLAFVAIGAHHFLGAKIRKSTTNQAFRGLSTTLAAVTFSLACVAAVFIIILRP